MKGRIGVLTTDPELRITSWDATLAAMTGVPAEDARGRALDALIPDLQARGILALIREPLVSGAPRILAPAIHHFLIPCPPAVPSSEFDVMQQRVVVGALRDGNGTVGLAFTVEDVTERLQQERHLARQLRGGDRASRMRAIELCSAIEPVDGLGPLGTAMGDEDWQVRRAAVRTIAARPDLPLVDALVSALREGHRDLSVLSSALELLTLTGVEPAAALAALLQDPDPALRVEAALSLGTQSGEEVVDALIGALADPDANVRFHVIESLGRLRAAPALERLAAIVETRDFFLAFPALEAVARIGDPAIVPRLLPLLADDMLGAQTADAIAQVGDEDAVPHLVAALDRGGAPVPQLVDALAAIHARCTEAFSGGEAVEDLVRRSITAAAAHRLLDGLPQESGARLRNLVMVLGWLRGEAVELALTRMLGTEAVYHEAIEAIVRFGAPVVDRLLERLRDGSLDTRRAAAVALGRIGDRRAVPALVPLLEDEPELIVTVAGALAHIGDPRAFRPLLALIGDPNVSIRQAAVGALNSIGHPRMPDEVRERLGSPDRHVRESAVKIAGYFGYADCIDRLLACGADPEEEVRVAALEQLGYLDDPRAIAVLVEALRSDGPRARAAAARALAYVNAPEAGAALECGLGDEDSWVRYVSATSLGRCGGSSATRALELLAVGDPAPHVRAAAVEAIGAIGGTAAATLIAPFVEDADPDVAKASMRALGRVGPAAGDLLHAVLKSKDASRRAAAVEALIACGGDVSVDLLQSTASADDEPEVARAAALGLAALAGRPDAGGSQAVGALLELAADRERDVTAVAALAQLPAGAIPLLGASLSSADVRLRRACVAALARLPHPASSAYLRMALCDSDPLTRQTAVAALSRVGASGLARTFGEMAQGDESPEVRRTALAAVRRYGQRGGTRGCRRGRVTR